MVATCNILMAFVRLQDKLMENVLFAYKTSSWRNKVYYSEIIKCQLAHSVQPASHPHAPTKEVVGSVPVRRRLRDMNHQLTAKSTLKTVAYRDHRGEDIFFMEIIRLLRLIATSYNIGDRSASPPDSSLIWDSFGHSGWISARPQGAAVDACCRAWDLWESNPR